MMPDNRMREQRPCLALWLGILAMVALICSAHATAHPPDLAASPLVRQLDTWSFYPAIQDGKLYFVEFYVPDCRGCKRLIQTWDALALAMQPYPEVVVARFNCEQGVALCDKLDVQHTPSLKLFHQGKEVLTYRADVLHLDLLKPFLMKMKDQVLQAQPDDVALGTGSQKAASVEL